MSTFTKALVSTVVAGAMAVSAAAPAAAQDRNRDRDRGDGISAGEVIAGAVILGGLAAVIASSNNNDRDRYNDRDYRGNDRRGDYNGGGYNARTAVDECVRAAERQAQRGTGVNAEVYEIRNIERTRRGFEINGRIAVRNDYRGRGWGGEYRRGGRQNAGWDEGRFSCDWNNGRVNGIDYNGIRNL